MARVESKALAGYYPLDVDVMAMVAKLIDPTLTQSSSEEHAGTYAFFDPCAGTGEAIVYLASSLTETLIQRDRKRDKPMGVIYACELEESRAHQLQERIKNCDSGGSSHYSYSGPRAAHRALHGDAFRLNWSNLNPERGIYGSQCDRGASVLLLNPPYDYDETHKRSEAKWLVHFTESLTPGSGILLFVVPHYALNVCAETLVRHYDNIHCFRYPDDKFDAYKQCVLVAVRRQKPLAMKLDCNDSMVGTIFDWASNAKTMPVLEEPVSPVVVLQPYARDGLEHFVLSEGYDQIALRHVSTWQYGKSDDLNWVIATGLNRNAGDLIGGRFYVAAPPRPGHLVDALAAGVLNSGVIYPNDDSLNLPPILIKGRFSPTQKTLAETEKRVKAGQYTKDIVQYTVVQQADLKLTVLDIDSYTYYDVLPGSSPTGATLLHEMNQADVLLHYSDALARLMKEQCPPLHDPNVPEHKLEIAVTERPLWEAQDHVVQTLIKLMGRGTSPFLQGEVGTGKTSMACAVANALTPSNKGDVVAQLKEMGLPYNLPTVRNMLVVCPPHMLEDWMQEIKKVVPGARIIVIEKPSDMNKVYESAPVSNEIGGELTVLLLTREKAKLGHRWKSGAVLLQGTSYCPECGAPIGADVQEKDLANKRLCCNSKRLTYPVKDKFAPIVIQLAHLLSTSEPNMRMVRWLNTGRYARLQRSRAEKRYDEMSKEQRLSAKCDAFQKKAFGNNDIPLLRTPYGKLIEWMLAQIELAMVESNPDKYTIFHALKTPLAGLIFALPQPYRDEVIQIAINRLYSVSNRDSKKHGLGEDLRKQLPLLLMGMTPFSELQNSMRHYLQDDLQLFDKSFWSHGFDAAMTEIKGQMYPAEEKPIDSHKEQYRWSTFSTLDSYKNGFTSKFKGDQQGGIAWTDCAKNNEMPIIGTPFCAGIALRELAARVDFSYTEECQAHLFQAAHLNEETSSFEEYAAQETLVRQALTSLYPDKLFSWQNCQGASGILDIQKATEILTNRTRPKANGRVALGRYIRRHHRHAYDLLIVDEAHEYAARSSAQGVSVHRLAERKPRIILTGSLSNGYASPMFVMMWAFSNRFRQEFARDDIDKFISIYGYRKYKVSVDKSVAEEFGAEEVVRGAFSDRLIGGRTASRNRSGEAPGLLPLFILQHLLPITVTIHKDDLDDVVIPEASYHPVEIIPGEVTSPVWDEGIYRIPKSQTTNRLWGEYEWLEGELMKHIRRDRFKKGLSGKLLGALAELPSYFDRAVDGTGNDPSGEYIIRYPESANGGVIANATPLPAQTLLPKEQWLIDAVTQEIDEERNVIVTVWHKEVFNRLESIFKEIYPDFVITLRAARVPTRSRKTWIDENVVKPNKRILITNPVPISTGLNSLIHFNTIAWAENPQNKAIIFRQTNGRLVRPGHSEISVKPVRIYFPYYGDSTQVYAHELLHEKVLASMRTDGLDITQSLSAINATEIMAMKIGEALYRKLEARYC